MEYQEGPVMVPRQAPMLPWILFALVLVGGIGAILVEEQKLDAAAMRVANTTKSEEKARAALTEATNAKKALETRVQELQAENGRLTVKVAATTKLDPPAHRAHSTKKARSKHHRHHEV
jgi:hypothetical protein